MTGAGDSPGRLALCLRWSARATGLLSTGVVLLLLIGEDRVVEGHGLAKWVGLLFFPVGVILGLALAWRREALGAAVAAVSLIAFYLAQVLLAGFPSGPWYLIFTAPAFLFYASWLAHGGTMRRIQSLLLVVGATVLGACSFGLGLVCFLVAAEKWKWPIGIGAAGPGAEGIVLVLVAGAAFLGAIVGFVAGVRRINRPDRGIWKPRVWSGMSLGIVLGLALYFTHTVPFNPESKLNHWSVAALLTAALGMVGGVVARFALSPFARPDGNQRREQEQQL